SRLNQTGSRGLAVTPEPEIVPYYYCGCVQLVRKQARELVPRHLPQRVTEPQQPHRTQTHPFEEPPSFPERGQPRRGVVGSQKFAGGFAQWRKSAYERQGLSEPVRLKD